MSGRDFVLVTLAGQEFGIPVAQVRDVLRRQKITPVPLSHPAVAGLLNLRGRIVTAVDLRRRLGLPPRDAAREPAEIVVEQGGDLYALIVDAVGDVVGVTQESLEPVPAMLDPLWRAVAEAVYPAERGLVVLIDIARLLDLAPTLRAAS
ncbi:MAG TPA: chemotaxis protein CheW [Stellaceae bacterium]|jgi:purine-binding chemotaxis protein CheW